MTNGEPIVTRPDSGLERHIKRLNDQKRITGLQAKIKATRNAFLLVRVIDGVPVRWDEVRLTVGDRQVIL